MGGPQGYSLGPLFVTLLRLQPLFLCSDSSHLQCLLRCSGRLPLYFTVQLVWGELQGFRDAQLANQVHAHIETHEGWKGERGGDVWHSMLLSCLLLAPGELAHVCFALNNLFCLQPLTFSGFLPVSMIWIFCNEVEIKRACTSYFLAMLLNFW